MKECVNYMYLDPGFGGMLLQVIVALVAVGGAILFSMRKRIKNLFSGKKDDECDNVKPINPSVNTEADIIDTIGENTN